MKAVILAGGKGTRLHPVTLEIPKPLLTVRRKPILNYLIELFSKHGVSQPIILINKSHKEDYGWWQKRHKAELPKNLKIAIEPKPLGTFGGLKHLKKHLTKTFVLSNGDELKHLNIRDFVNFHKQHGALATIALVKVKNPSDYGVPVMSGRNITKFLEKPKVPPSNYISSGLYILEPEIFKYADFSKGFLMIERDIFPKLAAEGKLAGYKVQGGKWYDCGTFERWEKAIREW